MKEKVRVALDAMGGDNAPEEIIKGAVRAVCKVQDLEVILVGDEVKIRPFLTPGSFPEDRIRIVHASEVIEMAEPPVAAIRKKKDSSIVVGMKLVRDQEADAFLSAGSSGAVLVGGQAIVGRIRGIERAPFAVVMPTEKGCSLLLDSGANVDARPDHLVSFARMGAIYMRDVMGVKDPSVGIVNIGAEEDKGNALVKETFPLLKACEDIRFIGSVEAREIPVGGCDVLVCEAFAGNIVIKMYEGVASVLLREIKQSLMKNLRSKIGAFLIRPVLKETLKTYDASRHGGAPMLGLQGLVMKAHGNAKESEIYYSLLQCRRFQRQKITEKIKNSLAS